MMSISRLTASSPRPINLIWSLKATNTLALNRHVSSFSPPQNDDQLQWSRLKTDHFQKSLPRLPIPKLEDTCKRYLESTSALITDPQALANTNKIVNEFQNGIGQELTKELRNQDKSNKHTSYICEPWFDMYLQSRTPLVLNYNPFLGWKDDPRPAYNDQSLRAANVLISALRFYRSLKDNRLEPEVFHLKPSKSDTNTWRNVMRVTPSAIAWYVSALAFQAYALDMSQFKRLFCSTRIPHIGCDELFTANESKHVVLLRHGQFYRLNVLDNEDRIVDPLLILSAIRDLLRRPANHTDASICALSAEHRDTWAQARTALQVLPDNQESFKQIDSALLLFCLDDSPTGSKADDLTTLAHGALHGNINTNANKPVNRWFDKSLSLLVTPNGHSAVNFEHSWGDGVAVLRFFNDVFSDSTERPALHPDQINQADHESIKSQAQQLLNNISFRLNDETKTMVHAAQRAWFERTSTLNLDYTLFGDLSKEHFKKAKLSPDSMFQLAFQLAYLRSFNERVATYESCSTSAFRHGRTETVRPLTRQTVQACQAILNAPQDKKALKPLLDQCSAQHSLLTKQAAMGQGFDRHLFAMRVLWQKKHPGQPLPALYTDPSFVKMNHFALSTSTLYGEAFSGGGFGPVIQDGLGVAYGYVDGQLGVLCSSYKGHLDAQLFVRNVNKSLIDIHDIIS